MLEFEKCAEIIMVSGGIPPYSKTIVRPAIATLQLSERDSKRIYSKYLRLKGDWDTALEVSNHGTKHFMSGSFDQLRFQVSEYSNSDLLLHQTFFADIADKLEEVAYDIRAEANIYHFTNLNDFNVFEKILSQWVKTVRGIVHAYF